MSTVDPKQLSSSVVYPETDGRPMGETDLHIHWVIRIRDILKQRYRDTQNYVASNLLVYFEEGVPRRFVVPDVFVVLNCDPGSRRVYKVWEEPSPPQVVFEITSASTRREDEIWKPERYAQIGVQEYFLFDPTADYLSPPLQGFRTTASGFEPVGPDANGALISEVLGIRLELQGPDLVLTDLSSEQPLLTGQEAAEQRSRELEAEIQRLRKKLGE